MLPKFNLPTFSTCSSIPPRFLAQPKTSVAQSFGWNAPDLPEIPLIFEAHEWLKEHATYLHSGNRETAVAELIIEDPGYLDS